MGKFSFFSNGLIREKRASLVLFGIVFIVFLGVLLYSNILHAPFVFDDYNSIVNNEKIKNPNELLRGFSENRYLALASFSFNYAAGGLNPFGYHLVNNLIHVINALLVYYLVGITFKAPVMVDSKLSWRFIAFSGAFIFVSHPVQTQAVTYIVQRAASMATMFYLFSLIMYVTARLISEESGKRISAYLIYALSIIAAVFAMKSKEIAITLPVIAVLYELFFLNRISNLKRLFYLFPILLTMLIIPLSLLNIGGGIDNIAQDVDSSLRETVNISRTDYLMTQFRVIATYLRLLILPLNQSLDYSYTIYRSFSNPHVFLSFLFLLAIFCCGVYLLYRSRNSDSSLRLIAFGIFWFFITISVESSIIPIKDIIFEHRLYLPSIGFFIASVSSLEYLVRRKNVKIVLLTVVILFLSLGTYSRNSIWKDPQTLWEDVIRKFPDNARAYNNLGVVFKNRKEYDKATEQFEKTLMANHSYAAAYYNLGDIQYMLGNKESAINYFKKALELKIGGRLHMDTITSLGIAYSETGDNDNAVKTFKEAVRLFPSSVIPYNNLGRQYIKMGESYLAIEILEKGLKIREEPHLRSNLSTAYVMKAGKEKKGKRTKNSQIRL